MIRNTIHTFDNVASAGVNKVPLNGIIQVIDGDAGTINPAVFIQLIDKTGIGVTTTIAQLLNTPSAYKDIVGADVGGGVYSENYKYQVGDIVTSPKGSTPESFETYVCITDCGPEVFDVLNWKDLKQDLRYTGITWSIDKNYKIGDIVSKASTGLFDSQEIYIALSDNTSINPATEPGTWKIVKESYFVSVFTPTFSSTPYGNSEYPDVSAPVAEFVGQKGAYWTITGVSKDGYLMTIGPLSNKRVFDNDRFIWNGDVSGTTSNLDDNWEIIQKTTPLSSNVWDFGDDYLEGSLVTFGKKLYISDTIIGKGQGDPVTNSNWNVFSQDDILPDGTNTEDLLIWDDVTKDWKVRVAYASNDLTDFAITATPVDGDIIFYDAVNTTWKNLPAEEMADYIALDDLSDIDTTTTPLIGNEVLQWDGTNWVNVTPASLGTDIVINDISDVDTTTLIGNEVLQYDATTDPLNPVWVNVTPASLGTDINLDDLSDVPLASGKDTQSLRWNDITAIWEYYSPVLEMEDLSDVDTTTTPLIGNEVLQCDATDPLNPVWVNVTPASLGTDINLDNLSDVITTATDGDTLVYDGDVASGTPVPFWKNESKSDFAAKLTLSEIGDVPVATDGQILVYDTTTPSTPKWKVSTVAIETPTIGIDALSDVDTTTTPTVSGDVLQCDATDPLNPVWVNVTPASLGTDINLDALSDVDTTTTPLIGNEVLQYDATDPLNPVWINVTPASLGTDINLDDLSDVDTTAVADGDLLIYDDTTTPGSPYWKIITQDTLISTKKLGNLQDVPAPMDPNDRQSIRWLKDGVTSGDGAWEYYSQTFLNLEDTPVAFGAGTANRILTVNSGMTGVEFSTGATVASGIKLGDINDVPVPTDSEGSKSIRWKPDGVTPGAGAWEYYTTITNLSTLTDVTIVSPINEDILQWNNTSAEWENKPAGSVASNINLGDLKDVPTPTDSEDQQIIKWVKDGVTPGAGAWEYYSPLLGLSLDGLTDVDTTSTTVADGDVIQYSGGVWYNITSTTLAGQMSLDDLGNVNTSTTALADGDSLQWNDTNLEWENKTTSALVASTSVSALADVDTTSTAPVADEVLAFNGTVWVPATASPLEKTGFTWDVLTSYVTGDTVTVNTQTFIAKIDNLGKNPTDTGSGLYDIANWYLQDDYKTLAELGLQDSDLGTISVPASLAEQAFAFDVIINRMSSISVDSVFRLSYASTDVITNICKYQDGILEIKATVEDGKNTIKNTSADDNNQAYAQIRDDDKMFEDWKEVLKTDDINGKVAGTSGNNIFTGINSFNEVIITDLGSIKTPSSNLVDYSIVNGHAFLADGTTSIQIGQDLDSIINIKSTIWDPVMLKNNTAIQAQEVNSSSIPTGGFANLISRTGVEANTPLSTGVPGTYNNEVIVGDGGVITAIRATSGSDPVVRKGAFGATDDFKILTSENSATVVAGIADPAVATAETNANKINEIIINLKNAGLMKS